VWAGLPAACGLAAGAFLGTNVDNALVTATMVATAPPRRAHRIATGQVIGFSVLVVAAIAMALLLFEVPARVIGLLGLVPLSLGLRGLVELRRPGRRDRLARRAVGSGLVAAAVVTLGAGGDNLAVYIPLLRVSHLAGGVATVLVFTVGEVLLTILVLWAGGHQRARAVVARIGVVAAPLLYCAIGIVVLAQAGTLSALG
jgi:cadmium resistance protein CadD (predicted permease)